MKAHIVGGGFGGLAAAALLIRNANAPGQDITIYEASDKLGGGFFLDGSAMSGYNLPGPVFDKEFAALLTCSRRSPRKRTPTFPSKSNSSLSIKIIRSTTRCISSIKPCAPCMARVTA